MLLDDTAEFAGIRFLPRWLQAAQADALWLALQREVSWDIHRIRMFGRYVDSPRSSCWIGDAHARYRYSGMTFVPRPWTPTLQMLRTRLRDQGFGEFNSVLLNHYRDGSQYMGWHSDDERELGPEPVIASLSLGAPRRFLLRRRDSPAHRIEFLLGHGDLLLMEGASQRDYQHALPKMARVQQERINLTFRLIQP